LLLLPALLSVLFLVGRQFLVGVVLAALVVVVVVSRAEIRERNVAGGYALTRGYLQLVKGFALLAVYAVIVALFFIIRADHWTSDTRGRVAMWALIGLSFFLVREILRLGEEAGRWLRGGEMEVAAASALDVRRGEGWLVTHDVKKDRGGNVDHFVSGPSGAFAIETKTGRGSAADRNQAVWNAVWAKEKFGQRWVSAVLCVGSEPPSQPEKRGHVWVLGRADLVAFLRSGVR
jgi:Nuclease-related domain